MYFTFLYCLPHEFGNTLYFEMLPKWVRSENCHCYSITVSLRVIYFPLHIAVNILQFFVPAEFNFTFANRPNLLINKTQKFLLQFCGAKLWRIITMPLQFGPWNQTHSNFHVFENFIWMNKEWKYYTKIAFIAYTLSFFTVWPMNSEMLCIWKFYLIA